MIRYDEVDFAAEARRLTGGHGVRWSMTASAARPSSASLDSLARRGMMVLFGASSGPVPPVDLSILVAKGSLYVTRPSLGHYIATTEELAERAGRGRAGLDRRREAEAATSAWSSPWPRPPRPIAPSKGAARRGRCC